MSSSSKETAQLFGQLTDFMEEIAAEKVAAANTEAGGHAGASSHPSTDVDDGTADASEGARSAENSADVKSDVDGSSPDNISEGDVGGSQDDRQLNIGTQQSATGEDASVEQDFKGSKDDPGTSHPADTEDGEKFGSFEEKCARASFNEAKNAALSLGNDVLADFANGYGFGEVQYQKKANAPSAQNRAVAPVTHEQVAPSADVVDPAVKQAADAGYQLASILGMEKLSEDQRAQATIEQTIKEAGYDADMVGSYLVTLAEEAEKQAEGDLEDVIGGAAESEDHDSPGDEASGMEEGGDVDAGLESPESEILEEVAEEAPVEDALIGGPSEDEVAEVIQSLVEAAPEEESAISDEEALAQLAMALQETGIPEEELLAAAPVEGAKLASAIKAYKRSGNFQFKEAANDRERKIRDLMKAHVIELVG
tara:strand:+ start:3672 stop:4946 length:1275 start_codon:yes stop_codon:yes gene_type:complete